MGSLPDERLDYYIVEFAHGTPDDQEVTTLLQELRQARATIEQQRQDLERIATTKFEGPPSLDPVVILQEIAREALSEGDSGCTCLRRVDGLGNPTGIRRDPVCPVHGDLARASAQVKVEGDSTEPEEWKCGRCGSERWETRDIGQIYCQDCGTKGGIAIAG